MPLAGDHRPNGVSLLDRRALQVLRTESVRQEGESGLVAENVLDADVGFAVLGEF